MIKVVGFLILFISAYWLSYEFDWVMLLWFIIGVAICFFEEILSHCLIIYRKGKYDRK